MIKHSPAQNISSSKQHYQFQGSFQDNYIITNANQNHSNKLKQQNSFGVKKRTSIQTDPLTVQNTGENHKNTGENHKRYQKINQNKNKSNYPYSISEVSANTLKIQTAHNFNINKTSISKNISKFNSEIQQETNENGNLQISQKKLKKQQIYVSQFVVDEKDEQQNNKNDQIMTNIQRIINCKNQTASLISQVQLYIQIINKLKYENKNYRQHLENKQIQNRQMKDIIHCKEMQIIQLKQSKQRMARLYAIQCSKVSALKASYLSSQRQKWEEMLRQNLMEIQQHFTMNISDQQYQQGESIAQSISKLRLNEKQQKQHMNTDPKNIKPKNNQSTFIQYQNQNTNTNTNSIKRSRNNSYHNPQQSNKAIKRIQRSINISKVLQQNNESSVGRIIKKQSNMYGTIKHRNWCEESTIM